MNSEIKRNNKPDIHEGSETLKTHVTLLSAVLIFSLILRQDILFGQTGDDANVFCQAGRAIFQHQNPYLTSVLGTDFSWNYPPVFAHGFHFLCSWLDFEHNYVLLYLPLLFLGLFPWLDRDSWLYGTALCLTGLYSFGWTVLTGNVGTIEFFLFSLSAYFLIRKSYEASFFLLGLMASIKIAPILYFPIFLLFTDTIRDRRRAVFFAAAGFLLPITISSITNFELMSWYFKQLLGLIPGQHAAFNENLGRIYNPLFSSMILSLLGLGSLDNRADFAISLSSWVLAFIFGLYVWRKVGQRKMLTNQWETVFGVAAVVFTLLMPRLKPYGFLPALLFFYVASRHQKKSLQRLYIALLSIFPNIVYLMTFFSLDKVEFQSLDWLPVFLSNFFVTVQTFHQTFFLLLATILLVMSIKTTHVQDLQMKPSSEFEK